MWEISIQQGALAKSHETNNQNLHIYILAQVTYNYSDPNALIISVISIILISSPSYGPAMAITLLAGRCGIPLRSNIFTMGPSQLRCSYSESVLPASAIGGAVDFRHFLLVTRPTFHLSLSLLWKSWLERLEVGPDGIDFNRTWDSPHYQLVK